MQIVRIGNGFNESLSAETIGGKAANLARMAALGLPVPPAFVIPIELCTAIVHDNARAKQELMNALTEGIEFLEKATGKQFGGRRQPLLVSVRSGAARSMPGMLETVLDVGCSQAAVHGLVRMTGNPRFAWDCRRRFLESYGSVVLGVAPAAFAKQLSDLTAAENAAGEGRLDSEALERLSKSYEQLLEDEDCILSEAPMEQLMAAAQAVYRSWTSPRAQAYRQHEHLEDLQGTAVTVQAMVFGNKGHSSGAGVAFSRDPSTGAAQPVVEVLFEAQGEDIVSGSRTPDKGEVIARSLPEAAVQLRESLALLEQEFGDVQDAEFTIEDGRLWILQTRSAKRTAQAALRFAIDFVAEGRLSPAEGLQRMKGLDLDALAHQRFADAPKAAAEGTGASAGLAVGRAVFDSQSAQRLVKNGDPLILIRPETSTADVVGFSICAGILTAVGGQTAHAALVARQMGKPCIVGCDSLKIETSGHGARLGETAIREGDWLSIDGGDGSVYLDRCTVITERPDKELAEIERWKALEPTQASHPPAQLALAPRAG